jgi:hypothetical protein
VPPDLLVISCEEDYEACAPLLEKGRAYCTVLCILFPSQDLGSQLIHISTHPTQQVLVFSAWSFY